MTETQFDRLTRTLAGGFSRRAFFRLLPAGGVALIAAKHRGAPDVLAQEAGLNQTGWGFGPGESCVSNAQCDNSFPELGILVCDDNGYTYGLYGGDLHCCRYEGGSCGGPLSDAHNFCCGDLLCAQGRCTSF